MGQRGIITELKAVAMTAKHQEQQEQEDQEQQHTTDENDVNDDKTCRVPMIRQIAIHTGIMIDPRPAQMKIAFFYDQQILTWQRTVH